MWSNYNLIELNSVEIMLHLKWINSIDIWCIPKRGSCLFIYSSYETLIWPCRLSSLLHKRIGPSVLSQITKMSSTYLLYKHIFSIRAWARFSTYLINASANNAHKEIPIASLSVWWQYFPSVSNDNKSLWDVFLLPISFKSHCMHYELIKLTLVTTNWF